MKSYILFLFVLLISIAAYSQDKNQQKFYVGTYTSAGADGIYLCGLNLETGAIKMEKSFSGIENPSFVKLSPDRQYLYSVSEAGEKGSFVYAYKVGEDHYLTFLNKQSSNGQGPCHVDVSPDGKFVVTATYGGGTTSLYPVSSNGGLKKASSVNINKGASVNKKRQNKPHAHSMKFSPYGNQVIGADLGTDHLDLYRLENGKLVKENQAFVKMTPGAGPRHFVFHPKAEVIYVINELSSMVSVVKKIDAEWTVVQDISALPENFEGTSYCADMHISKGGKYLYGSNRGHNSIVAFKVNKKDHKLSRLGNVLVEGDWPRNFGITPDGKWMLVANQKSNDITVFSINPKNGMPQFTGQKFELPSPVCIEFL